MPCFYHYVKVLINGYGDLYRLIFTNFLPILNCLEQLLLLPFTFSGSGDVLLSGFQALFEQRPIAEDYSSFK